MKILLIEDDPRVSAFIEKGLQEQGYVVETSHDGLAGTSLAIENFYDLIILDIVLPGRNGFDICREIRRENSKVPILMLTALDSADDKIKGLDIGADDYIAKPFNFREILARVRALTRRHAEQPNGITYALADLALNTETKLATRGGRTIKLTAREYLLLEVFIRNAGKVLSRSDLAERVWDMSFDTGTNVIDVYVNYLRKKIDREHERKLIHTVIGMGYVMRADE